MTILVGIREPNSAPPRPTGYYVSRHATHLEIERDNLACAARDLITVLEEVQCIRTCDPTPATVAHFNRQQSEVCGLMQAYIAAVHKDAGDHGLEEDPNGDLMQCDGFDGRTWRLPEDRS